MSHRFRTILALAALLSIPTVAFACLWDHDTLRQERARFPSTLELITGKFLRHSKGFYEWRIKDRLEKLKTSPSIMACYDDLAVAYEKTGQHDKAIETILAKEKISPGLYETYSNLGTFHILAGDFEKGLPFIDKALEINPDAHFGRERYQKWLVEYALSKKKDGKLTFPLGNGGWGGFAEFLKKPLRNEKAVKGVLLGDRLGTEDLQQAVKGVLGMMRFANHNNPLLLEALGDLLIGDWEPSVDAKQLSARAYLMASYQATEESAKKRYRRLADRALSAQTRGAETDSPIDLEDLEVQFKQELADADTWFSDLQDREANWVREGKDADAEFDRLYSEEPEAIDADPLPSLPRSVRIQLVGGLVFWLIVILIVGYLAVRWLWWARSAKAS
jgi:tetratricopeptide (TPR) repeat protein